MEYQSSRHKSNALTYQDTLLYQTQSNQSTHQRLRENITVRGTNKHPHCSNFTELLSMERGKDLFHLRTDLLVSHIQKYNLMNLWVNEYQRISGDSWMYSYQRTPMGNPYINPI